jgi:hypothetical protein
MAYGLKLPGSDLVKVPNPAGGSATNLSRTLSATDVTVNSSTGTGATIPAADTTNAGVMTKAMFDKLAGIETAADVTDLGNVGSSLAGASAKATIVDADKFIILDSAASFAPKTSLWSLVKSTLKTYFDTLYATVAQANATHTGDVTGATALTLATVNSNVGSFTNSNVTVNAKGLVTAISSGSAGGTIATPLVYYVESTGNDGTGAVGNPSLPYATGTAAYNAGVTAGVGFVIKFGTGGFTIAITADISDIYFKQAIGVGNSLTVLTISGTPAGADAGQAGYNVTLSVELLNLTIACNGGDAIGLLTESAGTAGIMTVSGSNSWVQIAAAGGASASGDGGSGGTVRLSGQMKIISIAIPGGAPGGAGMAGADGYADTVDGCDLIGCTYTNVIATTFARCSYTAADITPTSVLACAAY